MKVFGISMVRDVVDVIRLTVLHNLSLGLDRILIVDNGSSDGTHRVLRTLGKDKRVRWHRNESEYYQAEILTELAREACRGGADWIVPFDADEFWYAPSRPLRRILRRSKAGVLRAQMVQFIQRREQKRASASALRYMTRRVAQPKGSSGEEVRDLVESQRIAYVEMRYPPKCVSRASPTIEIDKGNHSVRGAGGPLVDTGELVCLHAPLRSRATLEAKVLLNRREERAGRKPGEGWQFARWERLEDRGYLDQEWAANSYRDDCLEVYGERHPVIFDPTLRDLVTPHLRNPLIESIRGLDYKF